MRRKELYWVFAVCLVMLSSCLGDTNTQITVGIQEAVYQVRPDRGLVDRDGRLLYSTEVNSMNADAGDCFLIEYSFDSSTQELQGADSLAVKLLSYSEVPLWPLKGTTINDTIIKNEQYISLVRPRTAYIKGRLFLWTESLEPFSQVDSFAMSYDSTALYTTEEGQRTYNLYLRSIRKSVTATDTDSVKVVQTNAFNIESFYDKAKAMEEASGATTLRIAINYVSKHNKDTTAVDWTTPKIIDVKLAEKTE